MIMAKKKEQKIYNHVLGVDLGGTTRNCLALFDKDNNKLLVYKTISRRDSKTNLEHRKKIINEIKEIHKLFGIDILIFESIRLFSYGHIQMGTILSLNKVQTTIVNECSDLFDIYQVDVRSWKSRVLGTAKADKDMAIAYVRNKYPHVDLFDEIIKPIKHETIIELNHDLSDAICISESLKFDYSILQDKNKMNYK